MSRKNKRKVNRRKLVKFVLFFLVCFYISWTLISQQIEIVQTRNQIAVIDSQLNAEIQKKEHLDAQKAKVNDPAYIEKIAREKLDYVAPDEIVFIDANQKNK